MSMTTLVNHSVPNVEFFSLLRDRVLPLVEDLGIASRHEGREYKNLLVMLNEAERVIGAQEARIRQLESLSLTDDLTGLVNRRGLMASLARELAAARRNKKAHGVLVLIDLDGFKLINDAWGHAAGDAYLQTVATVLGNEVRPSDVVARLGGDEFAVLLTRIDSKAGQARSERLEKALNSRVMHWEGQSIPLRASFGMEAYDESSAPESIMVAADVKLYAHKARGKRGGSIEEHTP